MSKRTEYKIYPICVIQYHKTGKPKLAYKTETCFVNYYNLQTTYPLSSKIVLENATKSDYRKIKQNSRINEEVRINNFEHLENKIRRKLIKNEYQTLAICVDEKAKLVYDMGDSYLDAENFRSIYPKSSKVLLGHVDRKGFREFQRTSFFKDKINEINTIKVTSENWFKIIINDDIKRLIDDITNSLTPSRLNASQVIHELELIKDDIDKNLSKINSISNLIDERILEIARKASIKKLDIICSDKIKKLLYVNNIYTKNKASYYKYSVRPFFNKKTRERKFGITQKDQYGEWKDFLKHENGVRLSFDTFESAREEMIKIMKKENEENLE